MPQNILPKLLLGLASVASTADAQDQIVSPQQASQSHWAFQQPTRPEIPRVSNAGWVRNAVDAFIAAEHEKRGLTPNPPVEKNLLLRRVYLDLIGLPPTREELHAFLADTSPDAYEKVVDRLLAGPQYGQRWARHWMDIWRYSDWYGRRAVPDVWNSAPQIWRWRDWIVQSLNTDKGYDRMVMEMLAADEIAPQDDEAAVATGFLIRNWYALNPNQWMRDNVEHTAKAFLGLTINCAHCHDHKYDPISQEEYFRFRAFFEPIEVRQDRVPGEPDPGPFQKYDYSVLRKVAKSGSVRIFDEKLDAKTLMYRGGDERNLFEGKPPVEPAAPAFLGGAKLKVEPVELPPTAYYPALKEFVKCEEIARCEAAVKAAEAVLLSAKQLMRERSSPPAGTASGDAAPAALNLAGQVAVPASESQLVLAQAQLESTRARIAADVAKFGWLGPSLRAPSQDGDNSAETLGARRLDPSHPLPPSATELNDAAIVAERSERKAAFLAAQANLDQADQVWNAAKDKAASDVSAKEAATKAEAEVKKARSAVDSAWQALQSPIAAYRPMSPIYPAKSSGRRRALAEWIGSSSNPLTARVAVNHIWARHFGRPLVATVFDFGRNGKPPTHPELLDWLAVEFVEHGWSMRYLHRLLVTSNTYRQASTSAEFGIRNAELATDASRVDNSAFRTPHSALVTHPDQDNLYLWRFPARRMEAEIVRDSILHVAGQLDPLLGGPPLENDQELASHRRSLYFSIYPEDGGHPRFLETFDAPDPCDCYRRSESMIPQQALALTNGRLAMDMSRLLARQLWIEISSREPDESSRQTAFITAAFEQILSRPPSPSEQAMCRGFLHKQIDLFRGTDLKQLVSPPDANGTIPASADPVVRAYESLVHSLLSHHDFVTVR